jgi:hypothetical protein
MNRFVTAALCGSLAFCGAQAFANSSSTGGTASGEPNGTAAKQKLMGQCMSHEAKSNTEATEACRSQVENELMDIKNAGTGHGQQKPAQ